MQGSGGRRLCASGDAGRYAVTVSGEDFNAEHSERLLRKEELPIIARVARDKLWLSVRTIEETEFKWIREAFSKQNQVRWQDA